MEDSDILDSNGYFVQKYTINFLPVIYPNSELNKKENIEYMKNQNYLECKQKYEEVYKIPLIYETNEER